MKKPAFLFIGIMMSSLSVTGETHLSDDIGGKIFEASGNPYIIDQDVEIAKNSQTVIKAGCIFLFKSFTGINIYGSLLVEGTSEEPVVFTSINDANFNAEASQLPNAFDWNGIYVAEGAGDVKLRNFRLMYSVFGIKSRKDEITIQNGYFKQNGQFHFTINDNIHYVQDNISYSYNVEEKKQPAATTQTDTKASEKEKVPVKKEKSRKGRGRRAAAFITGGVCLASGVVCLITGIQAKQDRDLLDDETNFETPDDWNDLNDTFKAKRAAAIITGAVAGATFPVSLLLFVKKDKSTMTKKVSLDIEAGFEKVAVGFTNYF